MKAAQKLTKIIHTAAMDGGSRDAVALRARPIRAKCVHACIAAIFFASVAALWCCVLPFGFGTDQEQSRPIERNRTARKKCTRHTKTCDVMEFYDRYIGKSFHSAAALYRKLLSLALFFPPVISLPIFRAACLCTPVLYTPFYIR